MNKLVKKIVKVNFVLVLLLVLIISYGQILGMYVWQDDNGLFFKLAHINEVAGYFGPGPFGVGAYKYTITPYIPIYKMFGYATFPYFFLNFVLYFLTTICVYKVWSKIIGPKGGRIAGFLYAAGYIASDGFIRLFSSPLFSLSIVLISLLLLSYWNYYKQNKIRWYFLAILFFFLAVEFINVRTHYLIGIVVLFEFIFLTFRKPLKSVFLSLFRLIPFVAIFYHYYILNADQRSGQIKVFVFSLLNGNLQQLYGLISSWSNLIFPDWLTNKLFLIGIRPLWLVIPLISVLMLILLLRKNPKRKLLIPLLGIILGIWTFASRSIFSTKLLNLSPRELIMAYLGGVAFILFFAAYFVLKRYKKLYLLLWSCALINLLAYSAYNPTISYESVNRYLTHSFFPLVGISGIFLINARGKFAKILITGSIIVWGLGNMINSAIYQHRILITRSNPPRKFYQQLKNYVPVIKKGDVFYFDVAANMQSRFADAFSVASMPETTAMAWRYGVDRYDFQRFDDFPNFRKYLTENKVNPDRVFTFWYSNNKLVDTSEQTRKYLFSWVKPENVRFKQKDNIISFDTPISAVAPLKLTIMIIALPQLPGKPNIYNKPVEDLTLRKLSLRYVQEKSRLLNNSFYSATSQWQDRTVDNVHDNDPSTVWQPDRLAWRNNNESLLIDLKKVMEIDRFVWINGFGNFTPIEYYIDVSNDQKNWENVKHVSNIRRIDSFDIQEEKFVPRYTRFVRMRLVSSLNNDSPGIAEAWVVPTAFSGLNITEAEKMARNPFLGLSLQLSFEKILNLLNFKGTASIRWQSNKTDGWLSGTKQQIEIFYDGKLHTYQVSLPAGGTEISKIELFDFMIPGNILIKEVSLQYPTLYE